MSITGPQLGHCRVAARSRRLDRVEEQTTTSPCMVANTSGTGSGPVVVLEATSLAAERARQFIKRHNALMSGAERFWRAVDAVPAPVGPVLQSVKRRMIRETGWDELLLVVESLEHLGLGYWLAGGWGVDALVQRQTRRHKDIDIIIEDPSATNPRRGKRFWPSVSTTSRWTKAACGCRGRSNFEDRRSGIASSCSPSTGRISTMSSPWRPSPGTLCRARTSPVRSTVGTLNGRSIPCLTRSAQLLFHTGFPLENEGHDRRVTSADPIRGHGVSHPATPSPRS